MADRTKPTVQRASRKKKNLPREAKSDAALKARYQELQTLHEIGQSVLSSLDLKAILEGILDKAISLGPFDLGNIRLLDPDVEVLEVVASRGYREPENIHRHRRLARDPKTGEITLKAFSVKGAYVEENVPACDGLRTLKREGIQSAVFVPIRAGDEVLGYLQLGSRTPRKFKPEQVHLLEAIGNQMGIAVQKARLFGETERRAEEQEVLNAIAVATNQSLRLDEILQIALDQALHVTGRERGYIRLKDPVTGEIKLGAHRGISESYVETLLRGRTPGGKSDQVFQSGEPLVINDIEGTILREETRREGSNCIAWIPLKAQGKVVGILNVFTSRPIPFLPPEVKLLQVIGNVIGVALENARLFEETERRAQEQEALNAIATATSQSLRLDELLQIAIDKVLEVTGRERGYIRLKDPVTGELMLAARRGISESYAEALLHRRNSGGKSDQVLASGEPLVVNDLEGTLLREETRREGNRSIAWIPLKAKGKVVGVLNVATAQPIPFTPREVELLKAIGSVIGVALENARLYEDSSRLVDELQRATLQLEAKNRELNTFVYTVSHDLKAPLVSLQGMTDLLLQDHSEKLDGKGHHYLERLRVNVQHMERLISDLLALSRAGREGQPPEEVSLDEVLDGLMAEYSEKIQSRGIRVTRHPLPTLWGIRTQIEQVMANLLGNAIKYLGATSSPLIEIGARDEGETVECYVRDNGIGIDPAYHEKIFEIFQRLKETEAEGTGVGLAIVKKIIEGVGGRTWVESAKGQGATFYFTWPKTHKQTEASL